MAEQSEVFLSFLRRALPHVDKEIPLHEPWFCGNEWNHVKACLDSGWVSSAGAYVSQFEKALSDFTGSKYVVAVVNGTAALHICLLLAGVRPGDEVVIPSLSFVATANAVAYCGAVPHFADVSKRTLGMDPAKLDSYLRETTYFDADGECRNRVSGRRIAAVVPMHTFGHPVELFELQELCSKYRLALVEDAAESLGSYYHGRHTGTFGKLSAISFNGNKVMTTGGGGAILTQDEQLAKRAKHLTTTAKVPHAWSFIHDETGYNYRMPNLNAALGVAQIEQLDKLLSYKRGLAKTYQHIFAECEFADIFTEPPFAASNYWLNTLLLKKPDPGLLDECLRICHDNGIAIRPAWNLLHTLPMYKQCPCMDLSESKQLVQQILNLPSSAQLFIPLEGRRGEDGNQQGR